MKAFCSYVNRDWVGIVLPGGGDTKALYVIIEVFSATDYGDPKT